MEVADISIFPVSLLKEGNIGRFLTPQYRRIRRYTAETFTKYRNQQNKNRQIPRAAIQYRVETRCHTETSTLYIKFRANNTETEIKILKCSI